MYIYTIYLFGDCLFLEIYVRNQSLNTNNNDGIIIPLKLTENLNKTYKYYKGIHTITDNNVNINVEIMFRKLKMVALNIICFAIMRVEL